MGVNLAAGKGAAARTQCMYVDCPCWSFIVFIFFCSFYWREKIFWELCIQEDIFPNLQRHNESIKLAISEAERLTQLFIKFTTLWPTWNFFSLRSNSTFRIKMLSSEGRRQSSAHRFVKMPKNVRKCTKHAARESCWNFETGALDDLSIDRRSTANL